MTCLFFHDLLYHHVDFTWLESNMKGTPSGNVKREEKRQSKEKNNMGDVWTRLIKFYLVHICEMWCKRRIWCSCEKRCIVTTLTLLWLKFCNIITTTVMFKYIEILVWIIFKREAATSWISPSLDPTYLPLSSLSSTLTTTVTVFADGIWLNSLYSVRTKLHLTMDETKHETYFMSFIDRDEMLLKSTDVTLESATVKIIESTSSPSSACLGHFYVFHFNSTKNKFKRKLFPSGSHFFFHLILNL